MKKIKSRKINRLFLYNTIVVFFVFTLSACGIDKQINKGWNGSDSTSKVIVIFGKKDYVYADESYMQGIKLALQQSAGNVKVKYKYYDDGGDYEKGLVMAQQIAKDDNVVAVLSFQDFEVIDAEAKYFEESKKPLFAIQGTYETTLSNKYDYVFSGYLSSKDMGVAMAKYCKQSKKSRVVCCHTDTTFEKDEIIGFCSQAEKEGISIIDMQLGPDTLNDLEVAYRKWESLDADALYICKYTETVEQKEWIFKIIQYIKKKNPDFLIMGDYSLNGKKYLDKYGKNMDGVAYPNPYTITHTKYTDDFENDFKENYSVSDIGDGAYQGYDFVKMICEALKDKTDDGEDVKNFFKRKDKYIGVSGEISYAEDGKMMIDSSYYCVKDGQFELESDN